MIGSNSLKVHAHGEPVTITLEDFPAKHDRDHFLTFEIVIGKQPSVGLDMFISPEDVGPLHDALEGAVDQLRSWLMDNATDTLVAAEVVPHEDVSATAPGVL